VMRLGVMPLSPWGQWSITGRNGGGGVVPKVPYALTGRMRMHWATDGCRLELEGTESARSLRAPKLAVMIVSSTLSGWFFLGVPYCAQIQKPDRRRALTTQINELTAEITTFVADMAPSLIVIPGRGAMTAAKILGETTGVNRFRSKDAYARHNGTAPMPWSGPPTERATSPYRESPTQRGTAPDRADPGALLRTSETDDGTPQGRR